MCDGEGASAIPTRRSAREAVENHHKWVEAAKTSAARRSASTPPATGSFEEQQKLAADGLRQLCEFGDAVGINVIVENHGGLSSNGQWLAGVMKTGQSSALRHAARLRQLLRVRPLPGRRRPDAVRQGGERQVPRLRRRGNETTKDYRRLMKIVLDAGFHGWVGIEYEGDRLSERDGVRATKRSARKSARRMSRRVVRP